MNVEDLLNDDFLKQFKDGNELSTFLAKIQKRGIEKMLKGEMDIHLNYEKHQAKTGTNSRNGYSKKTINPPRSS